jgi:hypothetical protein
VGSELECLTARVLEFGVHICVDQVAGLDLLEAVSFESGCVLCFQQSTGNSAGPEVDIAFAFLAHGPLDGYVGDLDSAAGLEDAEDLR